MIVTINTLIYLIFFAIVSYGWLRLILKRPKRPLRAERLGALKPNFLTIVCEGCSTKIRDFDSIWCHECGAKVKRYEYDV